MNKKLKSLIALLMGIVMSTSIVACGDKGDNSGSNNSSSSNNTASSDTNSDTSSGDEDNGVVVGTIQENGKYVAPELVDKSANATYTYKTYTSVSPSNWNELTYQDNNDTQIMSYLGSSFFNYDFKFDENGEIVDGDFAITFDFATGLADVSSLYGYEAGSGMAWQITIREDGKWNDGTPIVAGDFVYTMEQQLDPLFKNYRADSFYTGATVIKNAKNYVFQGEVVEDAAVNVYGAEITDWEGKDMYFNANHVEAFADIFGTTDMAQLAGYKAYFQVGDVNVYDALIGYAGENKTPITQEIADMLASLFGENGLLGAYWVWADAEIGYFTTVTSEYASIDFDQVGIHAPDDTTIVLELEKPLQLLQDDGSIGYKAAYNMASLPLVKKDLYEANKKAPVEGATLWTSTYHSSVDTTASWGPYMLTEFQAGKFYKLEKNPNWYGWNKEENAGLYQTTTIECETIAEWNTAWMAFKQGNMSGIGIDVSIATDYKNSEQAYFTPDDYVGSLQLQSSAEGLKNREKDGVNKTILLQEDFRKALSLALNRDAYAKATTTSSLAGFGLFNSMHYYDVENGKAYRNSDAAKKVLCSVYGVDPADYPTLDDAVDAITGFDLAQARALVDSAVAKAIEAGDLKADANGNVTDKVVLTYGTSTDNEVTRRYYDNLKEMWTEMFKGTKLEGKFELEFDSSFGTKWANDFRSGAYDVCQGGWTGAAWDPGYFLLAYLSPDYMYSAAWDTSSEMMEFTMTGVNAEGEPTNDEADTYTGNHDLLTWYDLLNGDWQSGALDEEFRLELIAALEEAILTKYYSVPVTYSFAASLISFQVDYVTYDYNTFMAYGGIKYMTYNYSDAQWATWVAEKAVNGEINYK